MYDCNDSSCFIVTDGFGNAKTSRQAQAGNAGILVGALLAGLPILDVALVSFSRTRRGVTLVTGGRDHLTHRILLVLRSPRSVAATLAVGQGVLCSFAIIGYELGSAAVAGFAFTVFVAGVAAVLVLDSPRWRPAGIAVAQEPVSVEPAASESIQVERVRA